MKKFCFICILLSFSLFGGAQDRAEYVSLEGPLKVVILDTCFYFVVNQLHLPFYRSDTLAICSISQISDEFYKICSADPIQTLQNSLKVSYDCECAIQDSISISFHFSALTIPGKIVCYINDYTGDFFSLPYNGKPVSTVIPSSTKKIILGFEPDLMIVHEHPHRYSFQGIIAIDPAIVCEINSYHKHVSIHLSAITDSFFERYYVNNEYIRIIDDKLYWRGLVFTRKDSGPSPLQQVCPSVSR